MFKPRPYDPERRSKQTPAQQAATERNFRLFRLHGLHSQMFLLTGPRRDLARMLVDQELTALGAMTTEESQRAAYQKRARRAAKRRAEQPDKCADCGEQLNECDCIPF